MIVEYRRRGLSIGVSVVHEWGQPVAGIDVRRWVDNNAKRDDMTGCLTHFTRAADGRSAEEILAGILADQQLVGSTTDSGFIVGDRPAVCLTSAPLASIARYKRLGLANDRRFSSVGLAIYKRTGFWLGCRPVIYERLATARSILPPREYWRIVSMDLSPEQEPDRVVDFSHEREWRVPDNLSLESAPCHLVFPDHASLDRFRALESVTDDLLEQVQGFITLSTFVV